MINSNSINLVRFVISSIISLAIILISTKIKRNDIGLYFVDMRAIFVCFAISGYFLVYTLSVFMNSQFKLSILLIVFTLIFFILGFGILLEYSKIEGKSLIVKTTFQKIETVVIAEITGIKFLKVTADSNADPCIDIVTVHNDHVQLKSNMEDLNGFVNELKNINPKIIIMNDIPKNTGQNIINLILTFIFLFLSINKLLSFFLR
jgi:hypothetical protein